MQQKLSGETSRVPPRHIHDTQQQHARLVGHQQDDRCVVCGARFGPRCDSTIHAAREGGGQQCHEPAKQHHQNQIASDECQRLRFQSGCERLLSVGEHGRWHGRATIDTDSRDNGRVSYAITSGNEYGVFSLDAATGILAVTRPLDRESQNECALNVSATDYGHRAMPSY